MSDKIIVVVLLILATAFGYWITLPNNIDDCVLYNIKKANTDIAVREIYVACDNKFSMKAN